MFKVEWVQGIHIVRHRHDDWLYNGFAPQEEKKIQIEFFFFYFQIMGQMFKLLKSKMSWVNWVSHFCNTGNPLLHSKDTSPSNQRPHPGGTVLIFLPLKISQQHIEHLVLQFSQLDQHLIPLHFSGNVVDIVPLPLMLINMLRKPYFITSQILLACVWVNPKP